MDTAGVSGFLWSLHSLTFVIGDGRQLLSGTPVVLTAGPAGGLGGCQQQAGRVGRVTWLHEEEGVIVAATLGRSWGTVPIRDLQDL